MKQKSLTYFVSDVHLGLRVADPADRERRFVEFLRTGKTDHPFEDTIEMAKIIIAGIRSREEGGRKVFLSEIQTEE
jgi:hypothetical protein